ncbi:MAG: RNA polymerase sigma factor [Acidobacteriota bacterium]
MDIPPQPRIDFEEVFKNHYNSVFGFFYSLGVRSQDCHDLAQETFLRVYRGRREFRGDVAITHWIRLIAGNVWRNELRRRGAQKRSTQEVSLEEIVRSWFESESFDPPDVTTALCPEGRALAAEDAAICVRELERLPARMRQVAVLRFAKERSYREIAALLKISVQTVKSQLFEAREKLRRVLADSHSRGASHGAHDDTEHEKAC